MTKVILVAPIPPPYGGIANWVLMLQEKIQCRNDIELFCINTAPRSRGIDGRSLWERIVLQGIQMLRTKRELINKIKSMNPDVIHITTSGQMAIIRDILFLSAAKKLGTKTVYHIHFGRTDEIAQAKTLEWKLLKKAMCLASVIMPIDKTTECAVKRELNKADVRCVPNPIDVEKLRPYVTGVTKKSIMFVGWMVQTKGIEELIEAWNGISKEFPDYTLDLIGPGNDTYIQHLKSRSDAEKVVFHGEKPHQEVLQLMSECEVFILPSYTEGFPNVILEAMALRKPIIATDVGAIPDMLSDECGIVIPARNVEAIRNALKTIILDKKKQQTLAFNAYKKVNQEYDIDNVLNKYIGAWQPGESKNPKGIE